MDIIIDDEGQLSNIHQMFGRSSFLRGESERDMNRERRPNIIKSFEGKELFFSFEHSDIRLVRQQ